MKRAKPPGLRWAAIAIVLAGALIYANSVSGPFVFDDFAGIVRNGSIRDVSNLRRTLAPPDATPVAGRPLANLSFAVNYAIGGLDVAGYHLVNILLHVLCALLLYGLVRRTLERMGAGRKAAATLTGSAGTIAISIALLWIVHPLNSEVVDYLSQRTESMMAACYLVMLYSGLRAVDSPRPARWLAAGVLSCAAGMACKESMVTAPLVVVIFDLVFLFDSVRDAMRARWRYYAGLASTWLLLAALIGSHGSVSSGGFASAHATTWTYLLNQSVIVTRYLRLTIWPTGLVNYYGWARVLTIGDVWPYALFLIALLIAVFATLVRRPRLGFLGAWVFITLAPASSFAPIAAEVGAERRMYLPLMGVIALMVIGVYVVTRRAGARVFGGVVLACAVALAATTVARNRDYDSALTLARTTLAAWPTPNAHQLVGQELVTAGQHEEAIQHFREAVTGYPPARYSLGSELFAAGKLDEAIDQLEQFVRDEPALAPTRQSRILLARAFAMTQRMPQAIDELQHVLAADPADTATHGLLADAFAAERAYVDAIPHYRAFLAANPGNASAWSGLGVALVATSDASGAIAAFRRAAVAAPDDTHAHQNLARALLDSGDVIGAGIEAAEAVRLGAGDPAAHDVLGRVLAAQGQIDSARREFERALELDPSYAPAREALRRLRQAGSGLGF